MLCITIAISLLERVRNLRAKRLHASSLLFGGEALGNMRDKEDYFWIDCEQSDNLEVGIVGLCNIVALQYRTHPKMAEKALIAVLTSGLSNPAKLLQAVVTKMDSDHTLNQLRFYYGTFETSLNANRSAQDFAADLHQSVQLLTVQAARGAFKRYNELLAVKPKHKQLLNAVCAYVFSAAIKFARNGRGAAESALRRTQRKYGGLIIPERYEMSQQFGESAFSLIVQSLFLRYVLVFMYLSLYRESGPSWVRAVVDLGRILEESGVRVYSQIRDYLIIPRTPPLALMVFSNDLSVFMKAVEQAEKLGFLTPFVQFLNMRESCFFEARNFPFITQFLRGYLQVVKPNSNSTMSTSYMKGPLHGLGKKWGEIVMSKASSTNPEVVRTIKHKAEQTLRKDQPRKAPLNLTA